MKQHPNALRRHGCAAALVAACAAVTTPVAADELTFPAGEACPSFPLKAEFSPDAGHLMNRVFVDKNGNFVRFLQAGQNFPITFTNLSTGSSYRVKPEGTVFSVTPNADGSETWVMTGHTVITWGVSDLPEGGPATIRYVGRLVVRVNNGNAVSAPQFKGKQTDICAALS